VRAGLPVLRRRSTIAEEPPTTVTDEPQCLLCSQLATGTSDSNLTKVRGLTAKYVTQMNSADKDLFAINLLNLWKFIVIHRKFVK